MAVKKTENADLTGKPTAGPVPAVADDGSTVGELEPETGERTEPRRAVAADTAEAHRDRVAMVSRNKNGEPDQEPGYEVIVPDAEKDAAENKPVDNQVDQG